MNRGISRVKPSTWNPHAVRHPPHLGLKFCILSRKLAMIWSSKPRWASSPLYDVEHL